MPKLGAYSKEIVLARPDGRSREARLLKQMRRKLIEHLGGDGRMTAPQRALVERAAMLQLRCAVLDQRVVDGSFTEYDAKTYLAFNNSLSRMLGRLGLEPAAGPDPRAAGRAALDGIGRVEYTVVDPKMREADEEPRAPAAVEVVYGRG